MKYTTTSAPADPQMELSMLFSNEPRPKSSATDRRERIESKPAKLENQPEEPDRWDAMFTG